MVTKAKPPYLNVKWIQKRRRLDFSSGYAAGVSGHRSTPSKSTPWHEGYQLGRARYLARRDDGPVGILDAAEARYAR